MKMLRFLLGLTATVLLAQGPGRLGMRAAGTEARPALGAVKAALELSDQQVKQLFELRQEERQALQPLRQQVQEKRAALKEAREAANPNAATVGQLVLDLEKLAGQIRTLNEAYHAKALSLLTSAQREKLETLEKTSVPAQRARQATAGARALNLLPPPPRGRRQGD
ncbi:MAG: Spy/CpxP family protein refolding chaperone [Bryobacteraceae bacterium]